MKIPTNKLCYTKTTMITHKLSFPQRFLPALSQSTILIFSGLYLLMQDKTLARGLLENINLCAINTQSCSAIYHPAFIYNPALNLAMNTLFAASFLFIGVALLRKPIKFWAQLGLIPTLFLFGLLIDTYPKGGLARLIIYQPIFPLTLIQLALMIIASLSLPGPGIMKPLAITRRGLTFLVAAFMLSIVTLYVLLHTLLPNAWNHYRDQVMQRNVMTTSTIITKSYISSDPNEASPDKIANDAHISVQSLTENGFNLCAFFYTGSPSKGMSRVLTPKSMNSHPKGYQCYLFPLPSFPQITTRTDKNLLVVSRNPSYSVVAQPEDPTVPIINIESFTKVYTASGQSASAEDIKVGNIVSYYWGYNRIERKVGVYKIVIEKTGQDPRVCQQVEEANTVSPFCPATLTNLSVVNAEIHPEYTQQDISLRTSSGKDVDLSWPTDRPPTLQDKAGNTLELVQLKVGQKIDLVYGEVVAEQLQAIRLRN